MKSHFATLGNNLPIVLVCISLCVFFSISCSAESPKAEIRTQNQVIELPFSYFSETFMVVPVRINGSLIQNFIFDTGIGVNLISKSVCEKLNCKVEGKFSGKRMSGQEIHTPMSSVAALSVAEHELKNVPVGVFDLEAMMPGSEIGGFLSLGFFKNLPYSVDYKKQTITFENSASLESIRSEGTRVPVQLDIQGPSLQIFMPLVLPDGRRISVEVDTGSQILILNDTFMKALGVAPDGPEVRRRDGKDETGNTFSRFFTSLKGKVHLFQSTDIGVEHPDVMFQKIIYDGLVGHDFLSRFRVTYDLPNSEMIFRSPSNL
jgi:hypothetical protein